MEKFFNNAGPSVPADHYIITSVIAHAARLYLNNQALIPWWEQQAKSTGGDNLLTRLLEYWTIQSDKLKEPRVHRVIAALLSGDTSDETIPTDDMQYVTDLGLIESRPQVRIANRIYQEVIPRELT